MAPNLLCSIPASTAELRDRIERRFLSYAKEKHNAVNTSRKRIGYSRKDDRKSSGQGRVCA
jgi:hypothetical protein